MQPEWLKEYFRPRTEETAQQDTAPDAAEEASEAVSRRDFVKTGFVTGVAAGMAAGTVLAQTEPAIWITLNGIFINENLDLEELAQDRVYEFAWSFAPVPIKGATGAPGNSVAIA